MSVIENALRRAQAQQTPSQPATPVVERAPERVVPMTPRPRINRNAVRRHVSPASLILLALAIATFVVITQPGWGEGFQVTAREIAVPVAPAPMALTGRATSKPVTHESTTPAAVIGPEVDLSDVLTQETPNATVPTAPVVEAVVPPVAAKTITEPSTPAIEPAPTIEEAPRESAASILNRFRLEGVMMSGAKRLAIVNGAIVGEGQGVADATIVSITRRDMVIEVQGRRYHVPLRGKAE